MDEELKKTKADITKAKHTAIGLLKTAKITSIPIQINDLVNTAKLSFDLTVKPLPDKAFNSKGDALTQAHGDYIFIIYNDERPVVRKRFSIAHELGHLYLGHLHGNSSIDLNTDSFDEIEADAFAAHVLMPPDMLLKDIKSGNRNPEELAKKYNVSSEAMWRQIRNSGLINKL